MLPPYDYWAPQPGLPELPRRVIPLGIPPEPTYAPGVGGLTPQPTDTAVSNLAGLQTVSDEEAVVFQLYVRWVLPLDGYVFWLGTGNPVRVKGSLHVSVDKRQNEDETLAINRVVFTTGEPVQRFNEIAPGQIWVGEIAGVRFAFSHTGPRYQAAGLYHYNGDAVYPALGNMLVPLGQELPKDTLVVSNSLPMWLTLKLYSPIWLNPPNPGITLYPSYALPDNLSPPYGVVHIPEDGTEALQMAPSFGPTLPYGSAALGTVFGSTPDSTHYQLASDRVRVTLYGLTNQQALDWMDLVYRYSYDQDTIGLMAVQTITRDAKRTQPELGMLAMKKTLEFRVSYYQARANHVAQQMIEKATASVMIANIVRPTEGASLDYSEADNSQYLPTVAGF